MTAIHSAGLSDVGRRDNNEDAFLVDEELGLYLVADGVGGRLAGEVASATVAQVVREHVAQWHAKGRRPGDMPGVIPHAIEAACGEVHRIASEDRTKAGMSSTVTALLVEGGRAVMGHVGDSRMYLRRGGRLEQLSTDHTLAAELFRGGVITREQIDGHPHAHVLTRSCGSQASVMVETLALELHGGDQYLLCSDGLTPGLADEDATHAIFEGDHDLAGVLARLVASAKDGGSRDNITGVVLALPEDDDVALGASTVEALRGVPLLERLTTADLHRVVARMEGRTAGPGEVLMTRGDRVGEMVVVVSGRLRWELEAGHFGELTRGNGIGQTTLVTPRRSPGELTAVEESQVLVLSSASFRRLVRSRQRLGVALLTSLSEELSDWLDPDSDRGVARPPHGLLIEF